MSRLWVAVFAVWVVPMALADQRECEPAVDMADSHNAVNRLGECDYADEGINRWWNRGDERREEASSRSSRAAASSAASVSAEGRRLSSPPLDGALALVEARYELLQRAADQCPQAARLERELYHRREDGSLTLVVEFSCTQRP